MKNKKFLLLPLLLCAVTSCSGGGDNPPPEPIKHTFNFVGENCFLKDSAGAEITSAIVNDGDSLTYTIFVKEEDKYKLPGDITVTEGVDYTYTPSKNELKINNITKDVSVTAKALEKDKIYIGYTMSHIEGCKWEGPYSVNPKTEIVANAVLADGYTLSQENITVLVTGVGLLTKGYTYNSTTKKLTIDAEYVVGDIGIIGQPQNPGPEPKPTEEYEIKFNMKNATSNFPSKQSLNDSILGTITANKGYRCPTKEEVAENEWLVKNAPGSIYHFKYDEFLYYPFEEEGVSSAYLYIDAYYLNRTTPANSVEINGEAIELVTVTFDKKEGIWSDKSEEQEKVATIDKGMKLDKAASKCEAFPSIEDSAKQFAGWFDKNTGKEVYSQTEIFENLSVEAHYRFKEFKIYTENILSCNLTNFPGDTLIKWHDPVGDKDPKPTIEVKNQNDQLPVKSDVEVTMGSGDQKRRLNNTEFTYNLSSNKKSATFGINANVIEGDISISLRPYEVITVRFNPDGGTWPSGGSKTAEWVGKPNSLSYGEIYAGIDTGGDPVKGGYIVDGWKDIDGNTIDFNIKPSHNIELKPNYITVEKADFTNDTWANVIKYANQGSAALDARYGETLQIGAERTIYYKNPDEHETLQYKVRLIGRNHDELADGSGKKAALTFEFSNLIYSGMYGHDDAPYHSSYPNNTWLTSDYRKLMGEAYTALKDCNPGFDVKVVNKKTMQGKSGDKDPNMIITTQETLFPLSGSEMGIPKVNADKNNPVKYNYSNEYEGSIYAYYLLGGYYVKTFLGDEANDYSPYWLRSPHTEKEPEPVGNDDNFDRSMAYYIKGKEAEWTTQLGDYGKYTTDLGASYGYAAAFCI